MVVSPHSVIIDYTICFRTCPGQLTLGQSCTRQEGKKLKLEIKDDKEWKVEIKDEILLWAQIKFEFS